MAPAWVRPTVNTMTKEKWKMIRDLQKHLVRMDRVLYSEAAQADSDTQTELRRFVDVKPAPQNIQDGFLNLARREKTTVTIYLVNGAKLLGRIKSFDKFSLILELGAQEQLIFKHAISTISQAQRATGELHGQQTPAADSPAEPTEEPAAS